jgi:hypothetical protein
MAVCQPTWYRTVVLLGRIVLPMLIGLLLLAPESFQRVDPHLK